MDYSFLQQKYNGQTTKIGVIGATRGYGYTIISQLVDTPMCTLRFICSRHPEDCRSVLIELGYDSNYIKICLTAKEIQESSDTDVLIIKEYAFLVNCGVDTIIECTGNTDVGSHAAVMALEAGINVCMVSKETDSICGSFLNRLAKEKGVIYTLANGDQPRNLVDLCSWARILGLEIVCAGKSSENDIVVHEKTGEVTYLEGHPSAVIPELSGLWNIEGKDTLEKRREVLSEFLKPISADLCEMNLVSNITGLSPAAPFLNYPVARVSELADVFIPKEDGGILEKSGVVDVFYNLRRDDEASFAGGEFVIVKCKNPKVWSMLKAKGHIVGKNGKYACLYYPYHFLGVETPATLVLMKFLGIGAHPECRQFSTLMGIAEKTIKKGTCLAIEGHHHEIVGVVPQLILSAELPEKVLPFYVLNGATVTSDIEAGEAITGDKIRMNDSFSFPYEMYKKGIRFN